MASVISICNQKGGVGKTTTAINLAASLAVAERKTLLIDMDPQGNAGSGVGIDKRGLDRSIYNVLVDGVPIIDILTPTAFSHLSVVPSNLDLVGAEVELAAQLSRENRLTKAVAPVRDAFDFIVIDCPPSLGLLTVNALTASDFVITPVQCEYYAMEGVADLMGTIELIRQSCNPSLHILGVLLTMFDGRNNLSRQVSEEIRAHFGPQAFQTIVPRNVRLSEAPSHGKPVVMYDIKSIGALKYLEFSQEVMSRTAAYRAESTSRTSDGRSVSYAGIAAGKEGVGQGVGVAVADEVDA